MEERMETDRTGRQALLGKTHTTCHRPNGSWSLKGMAVAAAAGDGGGGGGGDRHFGPGHCIFCIGMAMAWPVVIPGPCPGSVALCVSGSSQLSL